ncbi:hypothetical protein FNW02_36275 [Komarekiella sp. 'clone 1']|uniref:Uncharacterized protein n=1 Tax=Komarekiella delphini-convector SJRDD-AB1 TaxID=2593771 RepID=A0AA41BA72_9NOST|nr:hypothetical protein [Komarekiella delphini-convector]MBD6621038.1 hypothetical protein [Komarekiella delphini-convector SJRDD-AB1]
MSKIEISQVIEQIKEEIEVDASGKGKASMKATARLAGVSDKAIGKALESANLEPSKLAQTLIQQGFDAANLNQWRTDGIPDIAIGIILHYYGYEAGRYCTQQAKLVCQAFGTIGVRAWMQDVSGWAKPTQQHSNTPTPALPPVEQRLKTLVEAMKTLAELTGGRLNPYMEQQMTDYATNLFADHNRQALTGTQEKWLGVVNFAESELGKKVPIKGSHYRGHLGTWVRTFYPQLGNRQENRLVNGTQQDVYVYPCHDPVVAAGLTKAVEEFFAHPSPGAALKQARAFSKKSLVTA